MSVKDISIVAILSLLLIPAVSQLPRTADATTIDLFNFTAVMTSSVDRASGNETLSLLVDSSLYLPGGSAGGLYQFQGTSRMKLP